MTNDQYQYQYQYLYQYRRWSRHPMLHFEFLELHFVSCCVYVGDFRWGVNALWTWLLGYYVLG